MKFDREFRSDAGTNDIYLWGEQPNLRIPTKAPCCNEMMPPPVTE